MSRHHSPAEYVAALARTGGLISPAAHRLGVTRAAVYKTLRAHPEVQQALEDARGDLLDAATGNVYRAVAEGDVNVSCWVLERLGKDRGWTTRVEVEPPGLTARELEEMSDDDLEQRALELGVD